MKRFVLGDIHGMHDYLTEVLQKSKLDYENDLLIQIGDIVDRGPEPFKCMDELMKIKNKILITGNHDEDFLMRIYMGRSLMGGYPQNGQEITFNKWQELEQSEREKYIEEIFNKQKYYHVTDDNILFVHGGFDRKYLIAQQDSGLLCWDRELWQKALSCEGDVKLTTEDKFKGIFLGHTPTIYWNETKPMYGGGVWNIDTGSGKGGPLTIMNIDTKEYFQSGHNFKS